MNTLFRLAIAFEFLAAIVFAGVIAAQIAVLTGMVEFIVQMIGLL